MTDLARKAPHQRLRMLPWGLVAVLLVGCSQMQPSSRPTVAMPAEWTTSSSPTSGPASPLVWRDFVRHPQLQALIDEALQYNLDLKGADLQAEQWAAQYRLRQALDLPAPTVEGKTGRSGLSPPNKTSSVALQVSNWEIDLFGRLASLEQSALAQYLAQTEVRKSLQTQVVAQVSSIWLTLQTRHQLIHLTQQTLASREESLRLVRLRFDHGAASALDLRQAESLVASSQVTLEQLKRERTQDQNLLSQWVGRPLNEPITPAHFAPLSNWDADSQALLSDVPVGLPSQVLLERADVLAAEQRLASAQALIGAARAAFFPRISLTTSVGVSSPHLSDLFRDGQKGWTFVPQISIPLFSQEANEAQLQSTQLGRDLALVQYQQTLQTAFREVNDALSARDSLQRQLEAQRRWTQTEAERLRLSQLKLDQGVSNRLEVLDAERSLFSARLALIQTKAAVLQNRITLFKVLGGL